jgi:hypothetical protein
MASENASDESNGVVDRFAGTEGIYAMPHHPSEIERLQKQHALLLSSTGGVLVTIPLDKSEIRVLDSGAADGEKRQDPDMQSSTSDQKPLYVGTWLLELARLYPEQKWSLHGVDIGSALFPPKIGPHASLDLRCFDIRSPPPESLSWAESFDLVHQRLLIGGLRKPDWPLVVRNVASLLKPGGWIQLVECEWIDRGHPDDMAKRPLIAKTLRLLEWTISNLGGDAFVADHLEDLLKDAGFQHVQKTQFDLGYGALAREEQWRRPSAEVWVDVYKALGTKIPEGGIPGVARDRGEFDQLLDELPAEMLRWGYQLKMNFVIGQKPEKDTKA